MPALQTQRVEDRTRRPRLTSGRRRTKYDNNGNLSSKIEIGNGVGTDGFIGETTNYFYSSENQLIGIKVYPQGSTTPSKAITYAYDALGRRIQKSVVNNAAPNDPTQTYSRNYIYDVQNILLEYDGSDNQIASYTYSELKSDDVLAAHITRAGVTAGLAATAASYQYLKDNGGSITDVADTNGNLVQHYIYSAFGMLLGIQNAQASEVTTNPPLGTSYAFSGREYDAESGFYYYRARYYDPSSGRFLQKDPKPGRMTYPETVTNSYIYGANNPLGHRDPSGGSVFGDILGGIPGLLGSVTGALGGVFTQNSSLGDALGSSLFFGVLGLAVVAAAPEVPLLGALAGAGFGTIQAMSQHMGFLGTALSAGFGGLAGFITGMIGIAEAPALQKGLASFLINAVLSPTSFIPGLGGSGSQDSGLDSWLGDDGDSDSSGSGSSYDDWYSFFSGDFYGDIYDYFGGDDNSGGDDGDTTIGQPPN